MRYKGPMCSLLHNYKMHSYKLCKNVKLESLNTKDGIVLMELSHIPQMNVVELHLL
jgi:hypothetical protein